MPSMLPQEVFGFLLVFARIGGAMMLMPGTGETFVPQRIRLVMALAVTAVIAPGLGPGPALPDQPVDLAILVLGETMVGLAIGMIAKLLFTALHVAGSIIGLQTGLSFAQFYDPMQGGQNVLIGAMLSMIALVAIFAADLHLLLIQGLADSHAIVTPGAPPAFGDAAEAASRMVAASFALGTKIAAPFIVYGVLFQVGSGVLARLMPQIQISFVAMPLQILLGYGLLFTTLPVAILWFLDRFAQTGVLGLR